MGIRTRLANVIFGVNHNDQKNTSYQGRDDGHVPAKESMIGAFDNASFNLAKDLKRSIIGPKGTIRGWFGIRKN